MKKVYILTNFSQYLKSYSPIIVVRDQLKILKKHGYDPTLIASEGWDPPEGTIFSEVETKRLPSVSVSNEAKLDDTFEEDVEKLWKSMSEIIDDDAVILTHDLIFLPDYVKHNVAARKLADQVPSIRWIHWVHSATSPRGLIEERRMFGDKYVELLSSKFPHSIIAFPNDGNRARVARNFDYELTEVFEVPHPTNLPEYMHPVVQRLYEKYKLWEPELLMIYPVRLDRGKNVEANIRIIAGAKAYDLSAKLIICDFQSTGDDKVVYRGELKSLAGQLGVSDDIIFMSDQEEATKLEVDESAIWNLFQLSNVFCLPSRSETYSLITQQALAWGNAAIINLDFPPLRTIYRDNAIYRQFGGNIGFDGFDGEIDTKYDDIDGYMADCARSLYHFIRTEMSLRGKTWVRRERNPEYVFKKFLEPLLSME